MNLLKFMLIALSVKCYILSLYRILNIFSKGQPLLALDGFQIFTGLVGCVSKVLSLGSEECNGANVAEPRLGPVVGTGMATRVKQISIDHDIQDLSLCFLFKYLLAALVTALLFSVVNNSTIVPSKKYRDNKKTFYLKKYIFVPVFLVISNGVEVSVLSLVPYEPFRIMR